MDSLKQNIVKTLLYYDIFEHPLKADEIFSLLPQNSIRPSDVSRALKDVTNGNSYISTTDNFYYIGDNENYVSNRKSRETFSKKAWYIARFVTQIIKRFPFVRAVLVTGSLSKNSSVPGSDFDFLVVTKSKRLWICRTLLMLFKKIFLFNNYKFFCINYFLSEDALEIEEKNIYTATEIVHIKSTFNENLMKDFINANLWVKKYFPNYIPGEPRFNHTGFKINNNNSLLGKFLELPFSGKQGDRFDKFLRNKTCKYWKKKYYTVDEKEREHMFKSTINVSKAHPGNMQKVILNNYKKRLRKFGMDYNE